MVGTIEDVRKMIDYISFDFHEGVSKNGRRTFGMEINIVTKDENEADYNFFHTLIDGSYISEKEFSVLALSQWLKPVTELRKIAFDAGTQYLFETYKLREQMTEIILSESLLSNGLSKNITLEEIYGELDKKEKVTPSHFSFDSDNDYDGGFFDA